MKLLLRYDSTNMTRAKPRIYSYDDALTEEDVRGLIADHDERKKVLTDEFRAIIEEAKLRSQCRERVNMPPTGKRGSDARDRFKFWLTKHGLDGLAARLMEIEIEQEKIIREGPEGLSEGAPDLIIPL